MAWFVMRWPVMVGTLWTSHTMDAIPSPKAMCTCPHNKSLEVEFLVKSHMDTVLCSKSSCLLEKDSDVTTGKIMSWICFKIIQPTIKK